jgi:hypothetical protein
MDNSDNSNPPNNPNLPKQTGNTQTPNPVQPSNQYPQQYTNEQGSWQPTPVDQTAPVTLNRDPVTQPSLDTLPDSSTTPPPLTDWPPQNHFQPQPLPTPEPTQPLWNSTTPVPESSLSGINPTNFQEPSTQQHVQNITPAAESGPFPPIQTQEVPSPLSTPLSQPPAPWPPQPTTNPLTNTAVPVSPTNEVNTTTSLDNPWGSPLQSPPIDGGNEVSQNPGGLPSQQSPTEPLPPVTPQPPMDTSFPESVDAAPTDLSHLITNNPTTQEIPNPASNVTVPETLIVPPGGGNPEVPNIPSEEHKGIPMWIIGVGIGLLLLVAGASAYFILGIGQSQSETSTSVPATTAPRPTVAPTVAPNATSTPVPEATGSGSFGELSGSGGTPQASSAADLIRQRQQGQ